MHQVTIEDESVYRRLMALIRPGISLDDVLRDLLPVSDSADLANPLLQMANKAEQRDLIASRDDVAEQFDTILRQTWGQNRDAD